MARSGKLLSRSCQQSADGWAFLWSCAHLDSLSLLFRRNAIMPLLMTWSLGLVLTLAAMAQAQSETPRNMAPRVPDPLSYNLIFNEDPQAVNEMPTRRLPEDLHAVNEMPIL